MSSKFLPCMLYDFHTNSAGIIIVENISNVHALIYSGIDNSLKNTQFSSHKSVFFFF